MKRVPLAIAFSLAASCGGSNGGGSNGTLANFEGAAWNASVTDTATCPQPIGDRSGTRPYSLTFVRGSGSDLQVTSAEGCVYKFNVSTYTATLVNAPVSCTATVSGITATVTWTSYTVTTTDGHRHEHRGHLPIHGNRLRDPINLAFATHRDHSPGAC